VDRLIAERTAEIESDRRSATAHGRLGLVYEANLMWIEARDAYAHAIALAPSEPSWRLHWAVVSRAAGDISGALAELRRLASENPGEASVDQRLGMALLEAGEFEEAEESFRRVVELAPGAVEGYVGLGDALIRQREYAAAAETLERAAAQAPDYRAARYQLGLAYRGLGDLQSAKRELTLGADARTHFLPDRWSEEMASYAMHRTMHENRAAAALQAGRADEAVRILEARLAESPASTKLLNKLAIARMQASDYAGAGEALDRALRIAPREFRTQINRAWWALGVGRMEEALASAETALELGPELVDAHSIHARVLLTLERSEEAADALQRAVRLDPWDRELYSRLSDLYARLGRDRDLEALLRAAVERWPELAPPRLGLARLLLANGRLEEAEAHLAVVRRVSPGSRQLALITRQIELQRRQGG
jgi:tetratricopeptide (TPR) repeat protein